VKEAYFTQSRPSAQAVEDYLSDATILVSDPQNLVAYFHGDHRILTWFTNRIYDQFWTITWNLKVMRFESGARHRSVVAYVFCFGGDGVVGEEDHCTSIDSLDNIFSIGGGREYRKGNVFNLRGAGAAPVVLPTEPAMTMDQILQLVRSTRSAGQDTNSKPPPNTIRD
jgi:hypothetical protein